MVAHSFILLAFSFGGLLAPRTNHDFNNARTNLQQSANGEKRKIACIDAATDADEILVRIQVEIVLIIGFCHFGGARVINPIHRYNKERKKKRFFFYF